MPIHQNHPWTWLELPSISIRQAKFMMSISEAPTHNTGKSPSDFFSSCYKHRCRRTRCSGNRARVRRFTKREAKATGTISLVTPGFPQESWQLLREGLDCAWMWLQNLSVLQRFRMALRAPNSGDIKVGA